MPAQIKNTDFQFTHKASGISTHRPEVGQLGFVEWCESQFKIPLKVCHRLDKGTSGALVFAKDKQAAAGLTELFTGGEVKKEYFFVSDKKSQYENWVVIEQKEKGTQVLECPLEGSIGVFESYTEFVRVRGENSLYVYKALPRTGKTHQIRKHAVHSQTPILGDETYGGAVFPRLMLHAFSIEFQWKGSSLRHESPLPRLFDHLEYCRDLQFSTWITSYERRETLYPELVGSDQALRLFHSETGDLRGDQAGVKLLLGWWQKAAPTESELKKIKTLMNFLKIKEWVFQWRPGVEDKNSAQIVEGEFSEEPWSFKENQVRFQGALDRGQNFGLFLDQRQRRQWLGQNSKDQAILNLFSFTCGFSLYAALGGASKVVSVDLSKKYLNWGKENFLLNDLDPEEKAFEWRAMDSREYLKFAARKNLKFDRIVCDPPSFSRDKKSGVFRVERDFKDLIKSCWDLLNPGGSLLFSTNYEKWPLDRWSEELESLIQGWRGAEIEISHSQWDHEWKKEMANLKAFFIKKA